MQSKPVDPDALQMSLPATTDAYVLLWLRRGGKESEAVAHSTRPNNTSRVPKQTRLLFSSLARPSGESVTKRDST
jgi:hypothetical protein